VTSDAADDHAPDRATRFRTLVGSIAWWAAWLVVVELIALGAAGLVSGLNHQPGTPARAELTYAGDAAIEPGLGAATSDVEKLSDDVDELGALGRGALASLAASKWDDLDAAVDDGAALVLGIRDESSRLRTRLLSLPGSGPNEELRISAANRTRRDTLIAAADATTGLDAAWARLTSGGFAAAQLSSLLTKHDSLITTAIEAGRKGTTKTALARIDAATATLDQADALRTRLSNSVDVATLTEWLRRNRNYDVALRALYVASGKSPDRVTADVRAALAAEKKARDELPGDTSGLVIIMAEIARGGVNQAVLAIEEARGHLSAALQAAASRSATP